VDDTHVKIKEQKMTRRKGSDAEQSIGDVKNPADGIYRRCIHRRCKKNSPFDLSCTDTVKRIIWATGWRNSRKVDPTFRPANRLRMWTATLSRLDVGIRGMFVITRVLVLSS